MQTAIERFWSRVEKSDGCWEWRGGRITGGYGATRPLTRSDGSRSSTLAHRISYELLIGPIPPGFEIDHVCRNTGCVNPAHLEVVTHRTNMLRGNVPAARQARQTHCIYGHPITDPDDYYLRGTHRQCKTCARAYSVEQNAARREGRPVRPVRELFA